MPTLDHFLEELPVLSGVDGTTIICVASGPDDLSYQLSVTTLFTSPVFSGTPTATTPGSSDNSTRVATTAYVRAQGSAPLASPAFTGTPTAPTASLGTNTTQIATTAFTLANAGAPLASPAFTGTPTAPTASLGTNTTQISTTAFVQAHGVALLVSPGFSGVPTAPTASLGTNTTQIATTAFALANAGAPLASPAFTGTPTAPTASRGTNTTQIATTAFTLANTGLVPTLSDASAPHTSVYLGSDHLDGNATPNLCRSDSAGNVSILGARPSTRVTSSSGAFDLSKADWFFRNLNGTNGTLTVADSVTANLFTVELLQDSTGFRLVDWTSFGTITWMTSGGTAPVIASNPNLRTTLMFRRTGVGTFLGWVTGSQA